MVLVVQMLVVGCASPDAGPCAAVPRGLPTLPPKTVFKMLAASGVGTYDDEGILNIYTDVYLGSAIGKTIAQPLTPRSYEIESDQVPLEPISAPVSQSGPYDLGQMMIPLNGVVQLVHVKLSGSDPRIYRADPKRLKGREKLELRIRYVDHLAGPRASNWCTLEVQISPATVRSVTRAK